MSEQDPKLVPCLVDRGVIFNKKDIVRLLQGLDHVEYTEYSNGQTLVQREGYVVEIFEDSHEASLFFNRRIHINVNSFEYLKVNYNFNNQNKKKLDIVSPSTIKPDNYEIELFMEGGRRVSLKPLNDPIDNPAALINEVEERRRALNEWEEVTADVDED
ncbi:MAG: hypothetical protein QNJ31_04275 [Candidatus Caenarcaniphilales bacterium]|nr:hypothetical protein [Candidatus Caenarcaniphilales bacterium]